MILIPFALYDAFTDKPFGGSQAGVLTDAVGIDMDTKRKIAKEIGAPATGFVNGHDGYSVTAAFHSTVMELPMCGHGTICLMTRMVELGLLETGDEKISVALNLPSTSAQVEITRREDGRSLVMLDINPPSFRRDDLDLEELAGHLKIDKADFTGTYPVETAAGDFVHLVAPVNGLEAMGRIQPDFEGLTRFCRDNGIETVAAFSTEVEQPGYAIHVRDFCPAVGVAESAAAGTTNAALTAYLIRHDIAQADADGVITVQAEQGHEIGRPSTINSVVSLSGDGVVGRLQVGGVATKMLDGHLQLPE